MPQGILIDYAKSQLVHNDKKSDILPNNKTHFKIHKITLSFLVCFFVNKSHLTYAEMWSRK